MTTPCCDDGHELQSYCPGCSGFCCELCGEDLDEGVLTWRCLDCGGLTFCEACVGSRPAPEVEENEETAMVSSSIPHGVCSEHNEEALKYQDNHVQIEEQTEELPEAEPSGAVQLSITNLSGDEMCVVIADRAWRVCDVKDSIESQSGIASIAQWIICDAKRLKDEELLAKLPRGTSIQLTCLQCTELQREWLLKMHEVTTGCRKRQKSFLSSAPEEVCADRVIVLAAMSHSGLDLQYAAEDLRADAEVVLAAVAQHSSAIMHAAPALLTDLHFAFAAVRLDGLLLHHLAQFSPELRANVELVSEAIAQNGLALRDASEGLLWDRCILDVAVAEGFTLKQAPDLRDHSAVVLAVTRRHPAELRYASDRLRSDRWFALDVLKLDGMHLGRFAPELFADAEVMDVALRHGFTLHLASVDLRGNRDAVYHTVRRRGIELQYAAKELCADRKIVYAAVHQEGLALQYANVILRNERKIALAAVKQNWNAKSFVGAHLKEDCAFSFGSMNLTSEHAPDVEMELLQKMCHRVDGVESQKLSLPRIAGLGPVRASTKLELATNSERRHPRRLSLPSRAQH